MCRSDQQAPARALLVTVLLGALAGCAEAPDEQPRTTTQPSITEEYRATRPSTAELRAAFDYDPAIPLDVTTVRPPADDPGSTVQVSEINYNDGSNGRAAAYLVIPADEAGGPLPGVIFAHGSDAPLDTFLDEARDLAAGGAVALLPRTEFEPKGTPDEDLAMIKKAVLVERRGLDVLAAMPQVDPSRLAVVGHSWGAIQAAIVAGTDPRPVAVISAAGIPRFSEFLYSQGNGAADRAAYVDRLAVADPIWQLAVPGGRTVFLQHGSSDFNVDSAEADELHAAAAEPREVKIYDAGHALDRELIARADRLEFLTRILRIA